MTTDPFWPFINDPVMVLVLGYGIHMPGSKDCNGSYKDSMEIKWNQPAFLFNKFKYLNILAVNYYFSEK